MNKLFISLVAVGLMANVAYGQTALSNQQMRDIDRLVVQLRGQVAELHAEFHEHLEGITHGEKLESEAVEIEKIAGELHDFVVSAPGDAQSVARIRSGTNLFIQNSFEMSRTVELAGAWAHSRDQHLGINHMKSATSDVIQTVMQIEAYLPPNAFEVDGQVEQLEEAVKELHAEFHEHLEGYEVSRHLDTDLEGLEKLVKHMHDLCHGRTWQQIDMRHLSQDIQEVKSKTNHIESLFVRQSQIGVRTRDWAGIEHSRDAITDVLSSAYLLEFMINKTSPQARQHGNDHSHDDHSHGRQRPKRDR